MENLEPEIRNAARALIVRDGHVLLLRKTGYSDGERYTLPGGGQTTGETLAETLLRECLEEIGTRVRIHDLVHVADHFKPRDTEPAGMRHLVEFLFRCEVPAAYVPGNGERPDRHQVEVLWMPLARLDGLPLHPRGLTALFDRDVDSRVYLGRID